MTFRKKKETLSKRLLVACVGTIGRESMREAVLNSYGDENARHTTVRSGEGEEPALWSSDLCYDYCQGRGGKSWSGRQINTGDEIDE